MQGMGDKHKGNSFLRTSFAQGVEDIRTEPQNLGVCLKMPRLFSVGL